MCETKKCPLEEIIRFLGHFSYIGGEIMFLPLINFFKEIILDIVQELTINIHIPTDEHYSTVNYCISNSICNCDSLH